MTAPSRLNVGIVGACGRGGSFAANLSLLPNLRVHAVCDIDSERLPESAERFGAGEAYLEYDEMLARSDLDAVIVATPMPLHAPQAIAALQRNLHVLSEVPAAVSIEECHALAQACASSRAIYMMAENYIYTRPNLIVAEIVRQGLLGETYYAEGEYLHELKALNEITRWRRTWQTGINGVTYPTHSLGPVLRWMPGDRVASLSCAGSGHHYRDPRGDLYENEDSCVMLCKMQSGGLAKIRVDMLSTRPHAMNCHLLQGTEGAYESPRAPGERHRIWLRSRCSDANTWLDLEALQDEFTPDAWQRWGETAARAGHGGGDLIALAAFVDAIDNATTPDIDIHAALDMTLPGLISQQSIAEGGRWIDVPDSRCWEGETPCSTPTAN